MKRPKPCIELIHRMGTWLLTSLSIPNTSIGSREIMVASRSELVRISFSCNASPNSRYSPQQRVVPFSINIYVVYQVQQTDGNPCARSNLHQPSNSQKSVCNQEKQPNMCSVMKKQKAVMYVRLWYKSPTGQQFLRIAQIYTILEVS